MEKEEHIRVLQADAERASQAEAETKRQLCASQQTVSEQAMQLKVNAAAVWLRPQCGLLCLTSAICRGIFA